MKKLIDLIIYLTINQMKKKFPKYSLKNYNEWKDDIISFQLDTTLKISEVYYASKISIVTITVMRLTICG